MKKTISVIGVFVFMLSFFACGAPSLPEKPAATSEEKITSVFPDMFVAAARHVGISDYETCLQFMRGTGTEFQATAPSDTESGRISVADDNGFVLNMTFSADAADRDILTLLTYTDGDYEGSVSDILLTGDLTYGTYDVNAEQKHTDVADVNAIVRFITEEVPKRKAAYNASMQENTVLEVTLDVSSEAQDGKVFFTVETNLPDETELMLSLSDGSGYLAQTKAYVKNGVAVSEGFTNRGEPLSGDYSLNVLMPLPKLQPENVIAVIGTKGEFMTGPFVTDAVLGGSKTVEGTFSFTF